MVSEGNREGSGSIYDGREKFEWYIPSSDVGSSVFEQIRGSLREWEFACLEGGWRRRAEFLSLLERERRMGGSRSTVTGLSRG